MLLRPRLVDLGVSSGLQRALPHLRLAAPPVRLPPTLGLFRVSRLHEQLRHLQWPRSG